MGGFRFPLEGLLRYRIRREDAAWRRFGESARAVRQTEEALAAVGSGLAAAAERLTAALGASIDGETLAVHARHADGLQATRRRLGAERAERGRLLETRRQELLERRRERQVVEEARRQAWGRYQVDLAARAQRQIDETATARYLAGRREAME